MWPRACRLPPQLAACMQQAAGVQTCGRTDARARAAARPEVARSRGREDACSAAGSGSRAGHAAMRATHAVPKTVRYASKLAAIQPRRVTTLRQAEGRGVSPFPTNGPIQAAVPVPCTTPGEPDDTPARRARAARPYRVSPRGTGVCSRVAEACEACLFPKHAPPGSLSRGRFPGNGTARHGGFVAAPGASPGVFLGFPRVLLHERTHGGGSSAAGACWLCMGGSSNARASVASAVLFRLAKRPPDWCHRRHSATAQPASTAGQGGGRTGAQHSDQAPDAPGVPAQTRGRAPRKLKRASCPSCSAHASQAQHMRTRACAPHAARRTQRTARTSSDERPNQDGRSPRAAGGQWAQGRDRSTNPSNSNFTLAADAYCSSLLSVIPAHCPPFAMHTREAAGGVRRRRGVPRRWSVIVLVHPADPRPTAGGHEALGLTFFKATPTRAREPCSRQPGGTTGQRACSTQHQRDRSEYARWGPATLTPIQSARNPRVPDSWVAHRSYMSKHS